jgi:SAM-dependent methyltransferase
MKCPTCEKPIEENKRTCSMQCAGKLAFSAKIANELRKKMGTKDKQKIREKLWKLIENHRRFVKNQGANVNVLDFWGGGLFADHVIDHCESVKNLNRRVNLYEIDSDPQLFPALRDYANRKNQGVNVKNHHLFVIPFCGSLAKYVHRKHVKNHNDFDFIWLDYCGTIGTEEQEDIRLCKQLLKENGILAISAFSAREKINFAQNRKEWIELNVKKVFPAFSLYRIYSYMNGKSPMKTYVFKGRRENATDERYTMENFIRETKFPVKQFA